MAKRIYYFGGGKAEGSKGMKDLLGGKGSGLHEMTNMGIPVPPGFTITTQTCIDFFNNDKKWPSHLEEEVKDNITRLEKETGKIYGHPNNPLLLAVRSGAKFSMPGMMETGLNIGLTTETIPGLIKKTGNERFVYDSYCRLIEMFAEVVMEKAAGIEPRSEELGIRKQLQKIKDGVKKARRVILDTQLSAEDLKEVSDKYKKLIKRVFKKEFPDDSRQQLEQIITAVFLSWFGKKAVFYRGKEGISDDLGTAVNVQAMVFGNMGENSCTGVGFTRNPSTGQKKFYGEYLINAQGEEVVAGIRTPKQIKELRKEMPSVYSQLKRITSKLEKHFKDVQDFEFTVEEGKLYMLQTRTGKRTGLAAVKTAMDMLEEKLISEVTAIGRVSAEHLEALLHPVLDPKAEKSATLLAKGLAASPGGATGMAVFTAEAAVKWAKAGNKVILVREETNPDDIHGMTAAQGILTARGGMTSHAAVVARGMGKAGIVGCDDLEINSIKKRFRVNDITIKQGDWISLNGATGCVYKGKLPMTEVGAGKLLSSFLKLCDSRRKLGVRANAETPEDAKKALEFGAEGIGLFRIEHMFYGKGSKTPLFLLHKVIISKNEKERITALNELFPYVKKDVKATLKVMKGQPVTIRTLDPPLHEFIPKNDKERKKLAKSLKISLIDLGNRAKELRENNPMMGHRGVRLGITYAEITKMQIRAIFEASAELTKRGKKVHPEIMIPLVCEVNELKDQKKIVDNVHQQVLAKYGLKKISYSYGTMIEIPRACLTADEIAPEVEFFSFGTNDLTQYVYAFSRDDVAKILQAYLDRKILPRDPFVTIDEKGVGQLMKKTIEKGRATKSNLKIGICGEHGGDPESIFLCHKLGLDYVSCSPYRVPIARLAAAQAAILERES